MTRENQEILRRILAREPEYNHLEWDRQWEENEQFMDNIARYPRNWWGAGAGGDTEAQGGAERGQFTCLCATLLL